MQSHITKYFKVSKRNKANRSLSLLNACLKLLCLISDIHLSNLNSNNFLRSLLGKIFMDSAAPYSEIKANLSVNSIKTRKKKKETLNFQKQCTLLSPNTPWFEADLNST